MYVCVCVNNIVIFERGCGNSLEGTFIEGGTRFTYKINIDGQGRGETTIRGLE